MGGCGALRALYKIASIALRVYRCSILSISIVVFIGVSCTFALGYMTDSLCALRVSKSKIETESNSTSPIALAISRQYA